MNVCIHMFYICIYLYINIFICTYIYTYILYLYINIYFYREGPIQTYHMFREHMHLKEIIQNVGGGEEKEREKERKEREEERERERKERGETDSPAFLWSRPLWRWGRRSPVLTACPGVVRSVSVVVATLRRRPH